MQHRRDDFQSARGSAAGIGIAALAVLALFLAMTFLVSP
jgi:hypothetical protein